MVNVIVQSGGTSGPRGNSVLSGARAPLASDGIDGDWWIDTTTPAELVIHGPRAAGVWPTGQAFSGVTTVNGHAGPSVTLAASDVGAPALDSTTGQTTVSQVPGVYMPPTRRMPRFVQPSTIITQMQSGNGFTNNAGSTITQDTSDFLIPSQAVKLTSGGTGAAATLTHLAMSSFNTTGMCVRMRVKVDDITHMAGLNLYLGSSSLTSYYKWIIQGGMAGSNFVPSGGAAGAGAGWVTVTLSFADATVTGSPSRSALTDVRWSVTDDNTSNPVTLHVQDLELIPDASAIFPNGVISIGFDDNYASVYQYAMPTLQQYGYRASVYTIQSMVGGPGRMTLAQLYALQDQYGWEMGSHAYTDADHSLTYTGLTATQLDSDLRQLKAWEIVNGMRGMDGTAYPLGQYGLTTDGVPTTNIVRKYNGYARTVTRSTHETFPPADPYRLRAQSSITTYTGGYTPTTVTSTDLPLIKANALWGIYVFHDLTTGTPGSTTQINLTDFQNIIAAINSQGIPVLPVGDVLRYYG